jgi:hypothetical protein
MYIQGWFAGLIISVVFGGFATWLFLKLLRRCLGTEHKPMSEYERVPPLAHRHSRKILFYHADWPADPRGAACNGGVAGSQLATN